MTGFLKSKAIGQIDKVLVDGKTYTDKQLKELIKKTEKES